MAVRGGYWEPRLMDMTRNREQSSSITAVGGTATAGVLLTETEESPTAKREKNYTIAQNFPSPCDIKNGEPGL